MVREASKQATALETAARKVAMAAEAHRATATDLAQRLPALKAAAKVHLHCPLYTEIPDNNMPFC